MVQTINLTTGNDTWSTTFTSVPGTEYDTLLGGSVILTADQGDDDVTGTGLGDQVYGGSGNDTIRAVAGNNYIEGNDGDDYIIGGTGIDVLLGNAGNDYIEIITSGSIVYGGQGDDTIVARFSDNVILSNKGSDYIDLTQTSDVIAYAGQDNDIVFGGLGLNEIYANLGDDYVEAGAGTTVLHGGQGNDTIIVNNAPTQGILIQGGQGSDTFELGADVASGNVTLEGSPAGDTGTNTLIVTGNNDLSNTSFSSINTIDVAAGVTVTIGATQIVAGGTTAVGGSGTIVARGTPAEILAATAQLTSVSPFLTIENEAGIVIVPPTGVEISRALYGLSSDLTEFFVIDGAQFATLVPPDSDNALQRSIGALGLQFGIITVAEAAGLAANPPVIPDAVRDKLVAFGEDLNDPKYIPQVTEAQSDTLLPGFYTLISNNGLTPVDNRFFSVIDTNDTTATTDDVTTLYFSSNGQFDLGTSTVVSTLAAGIDGFTPSNPPNTPVTLDTIVASTQIIPVA
jgi:hypothetical protein